MPWATRAPNGPAAAQSASACWGCQSPVSAENETRSDSVTVRPAVSKDSPPASSSK